MNRTSRNTCSLGRPLTWRLLCACVAVGLAASSCDKASVEKETPFPEATIAHELIPLPGGEFTMGTEGTSDSSPPHLVYVRPFKIDKYEVTNAQYLKYCEETGAKLPEFWGIDGFHSGPKFPDHPVVGVAHGEAKAYAKWAGLRLPTEAEWEYAARGGLDGMEYPTCNELDPSIANYTNKGVSKGTVTVGSYAPNSFGLHDAAGNVWEWVSDNYDHRYYADSPRDNPTGPERVKLKVIRGGGWHCGPMCLRVYYRNGLPPGWRDFAVGFRCAKDADQETGP